MDSRDQPFLPSSSGAGSDVFVGNQGQPGISETLADSASTSQTSLVGSRFPETPSSAHGRLVGTSVPQGAVPSQPPSATTAGNGELTGAVFPNAMSTAGSGPGVVSSSASASFTTSSSSSTYVSMIPVDPVSPQRVPPLKIVLSCSKSSNSSGTGRTMTISTANLISTPRATSDLGPASRVTTPRPSASPAMDNGQSSKKRSYRKSSTPSTDVSDTSPAPGRRSRQQQRQKLVTPDGDMQQGGDAAEGEVPVSSGEGLGEGGVRSSLLEEVLAEKRMSLMRSPEVMQFLQRMQQQVAARRMQEREAELQREAHS